MRALAPRYSVLLVLIAVPARGQEVDYNTHVRPILADKCFACHGPDSSHRKAGLRLDVAESALAARKRGAAIVPGKPGASLLIARVTHADPAKRMPPRASHKTLDGREVDLLRRWIAAGAEYQEHWAWVSPRRREPQGARRDSWNRSYIDRWIAAGLGSRGLAPSQPADRVTLLRRLHLDLTGLPPSPADVDAFLRDTRQDATERVVDGLLASPHFGERMAMYWFDLVRFADTVGYHGDQDHPISPYRDWVIEAFNANMPFDRFTTEQLAGDLLPEPTTAQKVATGYNRLLQTTHEGGAQAKEYLAIYAADRVRNFGAVWLGMTTGCAQCHDHKFDPFTQRDFYSLAAFFADIEEKGDFKGSPNSIPTTRPPELLLLPEPDKKQLAAIDADIADRKAELRKLRKRPKADARLKELQKQRRRVAARGRRTMITVARKPRTVRVLARGDWMDESGEVVQPAVPAFLPDPRAEDGRRSRLDLARWLFQRRHPLTSRVFVNRLWYLFFGKGISRNLDDFGAQGEPPVYPELLDALAADFEDSGWDIKHIVRRIVTSRAYQQSSRFREDLQRADPDNRLFGRQSRWRLPAESIRDVALSVSGLLVGEPQGGESVKPYQPAGYYQHLNFPKRKYRHHADARQYRRGVYVHWQRQFLHPALRAFDAPTREECCAERPVSNTPQAALTLLNDPSFVEAARVFAARLLRRSGNDTDRIRRGFRLATSRHATGPEVAALARVLAKHRREYRASPTAAAKLAAVGQHEPAAGTDLEELAAWTSVTRILLNLNETMTRN